MSAFLQIMRLELRALVRDRVGVLTALVFFLCTGYALLSGVQWHRELQAIATHVTQHQRDLQRKQTDVLRDREAQGAPPATGFYDPSNPGAMGVFGGVNAVLPPAPLATLGVGLSDLSPQAILVTTQSKSALTERTDTQSPLLLLVGRFDLVFVFVVLYPLIVLASSYDLVSRERELGRLSLIVSQPRSPAATILARGLARLIPLLLIALAASIFGFVAAAPFASAAAWVPQLLAWILLVSLYGSFWFALGALLSVHCRTSGASALAALSAWLLLVVIIPSAYDLTISSVFPVPSRSLLVAKSRSASSEAEEHSDKLLDGYLHDHPELSSEQSGDAMLSFLPRYLAVTEAVEHALEPLVASFGEALRNQQRLARQLRYVSPALVLQSSLVDLAGTGPERQSRFIASTLRFQEQWRDFFLPRAFAGKRLRADDLEQVPVFRMDDEPLKELAGRVAAALLALAAMTGAALLTGAKQSRSLSPAESS
jgi:ABC-2 type transport system permease protein